jgi:hypothetical protein
MYLGKKDEVNQKIDELNNMPIDEDAQKAHEEMKAKKPGILQKAKHIAAIAMSIMTLGVYAGNSHAETDYKSGNPNASISGNPDISVKIDKEKQVPGTRVGHTTFYQDGSKLFAC